MTVEYSIVARGNPRGPEEPKKYYPVAKSTGELKLRDLAERAAEMSTLNPADVAAAVEAFLAIVPRALAEGSSAAGGFRHVQAARALRGGRDGGRDRREEHHPGGRRLPPGQALPESPGPGRDKVQKGLAGAERWPSHRREFADSPP